MRKITLFLASLFVAIGAMAQFEAGKEYRIKDVNSGNYLNAANYVEHATGANGGVNVVALNESSETMIFTAEVSGNGYKLKTKSGYYVKCQEWNVDACSTTDGSVLIFEATDSNYLIKWNNTFKGADKYFKVENVSGTIYHFGDADKGAAATWAIEEYVAPVVYETEEIAIPTEDGVYRIYWKQNNRGYLAYHDSYPTKGVLADVTLGSYGSMHFNSATDPVKLEWYLITSDKGNKYLFNVENGKFLSYSEESADNAKAAYFDAARPCPITIEQNTSYTDYSIIKANVDDTPCLLSSGCGQSSTTGYPIRWNSNISGDMGDGGSPLIFVKVKEFPVDSTILEKAEAAINDYENPVEADVTFGWTTSTPWQAIDVPYYTSSVLNDNARANGIKYIEGEVTIAGARTATITFDYTGNGGHKLNVRGVEVIDEAGHVVAGDYKVGEAGSNDQNNPVYTVSVAEAGTYTVRCYATDGDGDNFSQSEGTITVSYAKLNVMDLTKSVRFAAEYATLYLGYKVAIPIGVEAYILTGVNGEWAHLEQIEGIIPANTGVILKATANNTYNFYYSSDEADDVQGNCLAGSIADRYVQGEAFVLGIPEGEEEPALCKALLNKVNNTSFKNNANKAYLQAVPAAVQVLRFNFDGTTGIEDAVVAPSFDANAPIYDLSGRRVVNAVKGGLYIQNGKKFIVK